MLVEGGAALWFGAIFYNALVQAVLLYGIERWVITYSMMKVL